MFKSVLNLLMITIALFFVLNGCSSTKKNTGKNEKQIADWIMIADKELSTKELTSLENEIRDYINSSYKLSPSELQTVKIYFYKNAESALVYGVDVDIAASTVLPHPPPPPPHHPPADIHVDFFDRKAFDISNFNTKISLSNEY